MYESKLVEAVLLVGHGGIAKGTPREWVVEMKRLEGDRSRAGDEEPGDRERDLDAKIRNFPRETDDSDPYRVGLESIATALRKQLGDTRLAVAFNEFCAPSLDDALDSLAHDGVTRITVLTTMLTPGGGHSEIEMPEIVAKANLRHPAVEIVYAWPYDLDGIATLLCDQWRRFSK